MLRPRLSASLAAIIVSGCSTTPTTLGPEAIAQVEGVLDDFRQAWLANDSVRVLRHVSEDVSMFVPGPGASTVSGKEQLRVFWFPGGGKAYPIRKYQVSNQVVYGGGIYAIAQGISELAWDTTERDSVVSSSSSKSEF
jgi:hypothetical protein